MAQTDCKCGADILAAQHVLDRGFQECFRSAQSYAREFEDHALNRREEFGQGQLNELLQKAANEVYEHVATALFDALSLLQKTDLDPTQEMNLYFWPGYRRYRSVDRSPGVGKPLKARLYYCDLNRAGTNKDFPNTGVGRCGFPGQNVESYYDCCQARWYWYTMARPGHIPLFPGSVYWWIVQQLPRVGAKNEHDLLYSFSVRDPSITDVE